MSGDPDAVDAYIDRGRGCLVGDEFVGELEFGDWAASVDIGRVRTGLGVLVKGSRSATNGLTLIGSSVKPALA